MTVGIAEAVRRAGRSLRVVLALDADAEVAALYKKNFPTANVRQAEVDKTFDGAIGTELTPSERLVKLEVGDPPDLLVGGPPCQGHSDLNNHTRRSDPKNALYLRMARAAEVLKPRIVIIENVTGAQWDKDRVVQLTTHALTAAGYKVAGRVLDLRAVGVPQRRRRFVLLASLIENVEPEKMLDAVETGWGEHPYRTVRWAIDDLMKIAADGVYNTASEPTDVNTERIAYLFDNKVHNLPNDERPECHQDGQHSYVSVYGRLWWDQPAQTITTGFGCMGQGRYVHPEKRRTITPHEAARLQSFPDWFDFGEEAKRGVLAKSIGNAVPPLLTVELAGRLIPSLPRDSR